MTEMQCCYGTEPRIIVAYTVIFKAFWMTEIFEQSLEIQKNLFP